MAPAVGKTEKKPDEKKEKVKEEKGKPAKKEEPELVR